MPDDIRCIVRHYLIIQLDMRTADHTKQVTIVIPCYNEEDVLPLLFDRLTQVASRWPLRYTVLLVDDGSTDGTVALGREFHEQDSRWSMICLTRNFGHQAALWTGLQHADGDLVAVLDADLQDPPEVLEQMFQQWEAGYDIVYGIRTARKEGALKRFAYASFYRLLAYLSDVTIPLDAGDFCVMDARVLQTLLAISPRAPFIRGLRAWTGYRQIGVSYRRDVRAAGEVKYTLRKLFQLAFNGIVSFSSKPLRIATYLGLFVSLVSFVGVAYYLAQRLFTDSLAPVPGFAAIVIAMLFLGGAQLVCIGILGEYVARIPEALSGCASSIVLDWVGNERSAGERAHAALAKGLADSPVKRTV